MDEDKSFDSWDKPITHDNAHARPENLDPRVNGPFLDEVRLEQESAYRDGREKSLKSAEKKKAAKKKAAEKKAEHGSK